MPTTNRNFEEKRNFIRMNIDTPVTLTPQTTPTHTNQIKINSLKGICKNLSGGGFMVKVSALLPIGSLAEVCVLSDRSTKPMLKAKAQVTRVISPSYGTNNMCELGLRIQEILT